MGIKIGQRNDRISAAFVIQLACLLIMGVMEFLNMTTGLFPGLNVASLMNAGIVLSILGLWAVTLLRMPRNLLQRNVILSAVMMLWFLILEMNRRINYVPLQSVTVFAAVYMIAFPFASMARDQEKQIGLRLVSGVYTATALLLMAFGAVLIVSGKLPGALESQVYWDGARLFVLHHPNLTSRMFMIGLALCLGFLEQVRKLWGKVLLLLAALLLFVGIALTNCRAVILVTCVIFAGNVFFLFYNSKCRRFLIGAMAAVLAAAVCFLSSNWLFQWNYSRLYEQPAQETVQAVAEAESAPDSDQEVILPEEIPLSADQAWKPEGNGNSGQGSLLEDLPTLNGRGRIWGAFFEKIQNEPVILLRGVTDSRLVLKNLHTHNAWLEALIMLGLPGFLLVLVFSASAAWASLRLLWHTETGMFRKNIALLTLATMVAALLEPCLFITYLEWSFSDFFFFLCLGYLTLWSKALPCKKER